MASISPPLTPQTSSYSCRESLSSAYSVSQPSLTHSYADSTPSCTSRPDLDEYLHEHFVSSCGASIMSELQPSVDDDSDTEAAPVPPSKVSQIRFVEPSITRSQQSLRLSGMKKRAQRKSEAEAWTTHLDDEYGAVDFPPVPHRSLMPTKDRVTEQWSVNTLDVALEDVLTLSLHNRALNRQRRDDDPQFGPSIRLVSSERTQDVSASGHPLGLEIEALVSEEPRSHADQDATPSGLRAMCGAEQARLSDTRLSFSNNASRESLGSHRRLKRQDSIASAASQHSSLRELDPKDLIDRVKARPVLCGLEAELSDPDDVSLADTHSSQSFGVRAEDLPPLLSTHYMNSKEFSDIASSERSRLTNLPERRMAIPDARQGRSLRLLRKNKNQAPPLPAFEPVSVLRAEAAFLHQGTNRQTKSDSKRPAKDLYTNARTASSSTSELHGTFPSSPSLRSIKSQNLKSAHH